MMKNCLRCLAVCLLAGIVSGCSKVSASPSPVTAGTSTEVHKQYIVVIDLSASRTDAMKAEAQAYTRKLVNSLRAGDDLVLLQMQQRGLNDHPLRWEKSVPASSGSGEYDEVRLKSFKREVGDLVLPDFFELEPNNRIMHTDIISTLHIASEYTSDAHGRSTELVMLSDMLQSTPGIEMDRLAHMPDHDWIKRQNQLGLLPSLNKACVVVVGADPTTRDGVTIRNFWQEYMSSAGARLPVANYRATAPSSNDDLCS